MGQNLVEKIAQRYAVGGGEAQAHSGGFLFIQPKHILTHDNTAAVISKFHSIGAAAVANPRQPMFALDHDIQNTSEENLQKYRNIEAFAQEMSVDFYPAGRGIGHQVMLEEGYAFPGEMAVASDSHANMYGGIGCLGTPVVRTDAAAIWATGRTWWQIPPVVKCVFTNKLQAGVTGKDVIITLCGLFNNDEVLNCAVEFCGDGIASLSIEERLTIANMTTEWGALAGLFPIDEKVLEWLKKRAEFLMERDGSHPRLNSQRIADLEGDLFSADVDAQYAAVLTLDLSTVCPHVSGPNHVKVMESVTEIAKRDVKIHKAYLLSCVNARAEDLREATEVVKGKHVVDGVEFYVAPASSEVEEVSSKYLRVLLDAGAKLLPPGCGPCIGLGVGLLEDGEVGISATNRNFKGRMGSRNAEVYLASPAVVAASAIAGKICGPQGHDEIEPRASFAPSEEKKGVYEKLRLLEGFPKSMEGDLVFCYQDNLNTDGIYPGKYTYIDDFPPEKMAAVVMENYDTDFTEIVKEGDILVGGFNFGTGSSREQAATALQYRGIQLVLAGSFSQTYKRNALNNGYLVIEVPHLVKELKELFDEDDLTLCTGWHAEVDFFDSVVRVHGKEYSFPPLGVAAQELIVEGGLEGWVKNRME